MKKAFTLAEVLITLMIIGIVAALTIPSVISNYQQQEFKTGLKKAVSVLNEAIQTNIAQEGETPYENGDLFSYLQRHLSVLKTTQLNSCYDKDTKKGVKLNEGGINCTYDAQNAESNSNLVFYTTDGMRYEFPETMESLSSFVFHETGQNYGSMKRYYIENSPGAPSFLQGTKRETSSAHEGWCGSYGLSANPNETENPPCILIVDVNGDKKPSPNIPFEEPGSYTASNGTVFKIYQNQSFEYTYPSPTDKKLSDVFTVMITDEKAIPFGVVAQRAMYSN